MKKAVGLVVCTFLVIALLSGAVYWIVDVNEDVKSLSDEVKMQEAQVLNLRFMILDLRSQIDGIQTIQGPAGPMGMTGPRGPVGMMGPRGLAGVCSCSSYNPGW